MLCFQAWNFSSQVCGCLGNAGPRPPKAVQLLQLAEEFDGIVDAIHAKFELLDLVAVNRNFRLLARHVGLLATERKVRLAGIFLSLRRDRESRGGKATKGKRK